MTASDPGFHLVETVVEPSGKHGATFGSWIRPVQSCRGLEGDAASPGGNGLKHGTFARLGSGTKIRDLPSHRRHLSNKFGACFQGQCGDQRSSR